MNLPSMCIKVLSQITKCVFSKWRTKSSSMRVGMGGWGDMMQQHGQYIATCCNSPRNTCNSPCSVIYTDTECPGAVVMILFAHGVIFLSRFSDPPFFLHLKAKKTVACGPVLYFSSEVQTRISTTHFCTSISQGKAVAARIKWTEHVAIELDTHSKSGAFA